MPGDIKIGSIGASSNRSSLRNPRGGRAVLTDAPRRGPFGVGAMRRVRGQRGSSPREGAMALVWAGIGFFAGILLMHCLAAARIAADLAVGPGAKKAGEPSASCLVRSGPRKASLVAAPTVRIALLRANATTDLSVHAPRMIGVQADALIEGELLGEKRGLALLRQEASVARTPHD